jgi:V/A-type H+-transporting ATPase subunit E
MALEGILEKITRNAEEKVRAIKKEGRLKREKIISKAETRAKEISERIHKEAAEKAELERRRASVSAELEYRKEVLREKQALMEECFQAALDELVNLPVEGYRALIRKMLLNLATGGEERVLISPQDEKRIDQSFIDGVNRDLTKAGKQAHLTPDGTSPNVRGGLVLRTEEVEVDCSFGILLGQLREELQAEVAAILFGEKE